ncbi:TonB-dependent receptor [Halomonas sp. McH1-25]|uniref:TonB-dependent receptor domain-containing protein n=1 Tax=unclassified Halomonas TaxID=2609666 RepID=UPI001EF4A3F5|nr:MULTISPECIES: TonB-dependent receptor [unclassified Halomonas]MCG7599898.1 TonB-dependent receptor [Halomonas sp. McH1-25]MCP1342589.1 TonB-dependent receptor [Halomonas sp. FL8]MCP1363256.1 TonB-dependent receptor [Halomonas sp. BBD45]
MTSKNASTQGLIALSLCWVPLAASAQDTISETDESLALNPVTVTATLSPRTANETLSSVTVIDEEDLERQAPTSLAEILRGQPGVDVTTSGSYGKATSVYIRGLSNDATLLMIDGIRLRSATAGGASWQYLDPNMFERAEIVRGPTSSLYGADAMGGVVQLFTPEGDGDGPQPSFSAGTGSHDTQRYSASLSGSQDGTRYSFAGSRFTTDGTEVREDGEDKAYDNTTGFARVSHTFDNGAEIGALGLRARGNTEYDGGDMDFVQQVAGIHGEIPLTGSWRSRLTLSESRDELDNFASYGTSAFNTRTQTARWQNTFNLDRHELIAGVEHSEDEVSGTSDYAEDSRDNTAVFVQALLDFAPFAIQTGLRYDDNEAFGEEVTGNLALGYALDDVHTLRASYATAFKAPTFNDLYYPQDSWGYVGNPDLEAETSETLEIGIRGQYARYYWDLAAYQTDVDDLIAWAPSASDTSLTMPQNIEEARIRGVELASGTEVGDWALELALTYTDPESRSGDYAGNTLPRRATQSLRFDVDRELGDWVLGGSLIAQDHRYDDEENDDRLAGYGLLNLRAGWEFAPLWTARLTVDNVFDKQYETAGDYINAGRAAFVSVNFNQ